MTPNPYGEKSTIGEELIRLDQAIRLEERARIDQDRSIRAEIHRDLPLGAALLRCLTLWAEMVVLVLLILRLYHLIATPWYLILIPWVILFLMGAAKAVLPRRR